MKLDKISWVGLVACAVALFFYMSQSAKNEAIRQKLKAQEAQLAEAQEKPAVAGKPVTSEAPVRGLEALPPEPALAEELTRLETETASFVFTNRGGGIKYVVLKNHRAVNNEEVNVRLNGNSALAIGELTGRGAARLDGIYTNRSEAEGTIDYVGKTQTGLLVRKVWSIIPDESAPGRGYRLNFEITVENPFENGSNLADLSLFSGEATPLYQREWDQQVGLVVDNGKKMKFRNVGYFGKGFFRGERSSLSEDYDEFRFTGATSQFFSTVFSAKNQQATQVWAKPGSVIIPEEAGGGEKKTVLTGFSLPNQILAGDGGKQAIQYELYAGPKKNILIRKLDGGRGNIMNYGFFGWVSSPLNYGLNFLHDKIFAKIADNWAWGLSVILITILIRIALWPLYSKSQGTMKRMSKLQPKMKELKAKYPDDPNKMNMELMKLYKQYKVNPMGGCLPMFLQIPIFFGFYRMLQYAVELRGESFLWVKDLSQPDTLVSFDLPFSLPFLGNELPLNLLPILMAVTMFIQMSITPKTGDKMQQRIFMLMPFMFFFFCYNFASALALYWTTQNIFSIFQTWLTQRLPEPELQERAPAVAGKASFMERMQARSEQMQKQQSDMRKAKGRVTSSEQPKKVKKRGPRTGG